MKRWIVKQKTLSSIRKRMKPFVSSVPKVRVRFSYDLKFMYDVAIEPNGDGYDVVMFAEKVFDRKSYYKLIRHRITAMLYWRMHAQTDVRRMVVHLSDGDHWGDAGFYFSNNRADRTLLPDYYFYITGGFEDVRSAALTDAQPWDSRSSDLVWRGGLNGNCFKNVLPELADSPATCQRLRMAWRAKDTDLDFKFVVSERDLFYGALNAAGFLGDRVQASDWMGKKYALDIDGYSNTWDNYFHRMLMGCCVLKVDSDFGFRQWYYDDIKPWEHFVPVKADLSDLEEKIAWVKDNDTQASEIAANGQALARAMTFESEAQRAGALIDANWERYL